MPVVYLNQSKVQLSDSNFLAEGGEGKIYIKGNTVYKIFFDEQQMMPLKKIDELSVLKPYANILIPEDVLFNSKNIPVGFTMKFIPKTIPLSKLFTTSFQERYSIENNTISNLIESMMKTISFIHKNKIVLVDGNEFNYLVDDSTFKNPFFIDTNCWQTPSFKASAIMDSIRDWHSNTFNELTDWFSFAIVACQLFIGIHPFKGSHPNFNRGDIINRMKKNISIFNKEVSVPQASRSFDLIPIEFKNWFVDLFEKGKRTLPPQLVGKVIAGTPQQTIIIGTDKFEIKEMFNFDENITGVNFLFGAKIVFTNNELHINKTKYKLNSKKEGVVFLDGMPLLVNIIDGALSIKEISSQKELLNNKINATEKLIIDNRLYIKNDDKLTELKIQKIGNNTVVFPGTTWNILLNSSTIYRGLIVSNVLGKIHFYIPYKENSCAIIPVSELNKYKLFDLKYQNGICVAIGYYKGQYDRFIFKFNDLISSYTIDIEKDINPVGINFVVLPNNNYILLTGEDTLEITNRKIDHKKVLTDVKINSKANLVNNSTDVYFYLDNKIYSFKMK